MLTQNALPTLMDRSRAVRAESERLAISILATRDRVDEARRRTLERTTQAVDEVRHSPPVMTVRLHRLSGDIGRSPVIEQAKQSLADQYGITPGEAFEILRELSSRSNRKLRNVAADLLDRSESAV